VREPLFEAIAAVIERHGGVVDLPYTTHLLCARRAGA